MTDRLIDWLTKYLQSAFLEVIPTCNADTHPTPHLEQEQLYESCGALLSPALPSLQEPSAPPSTPHAVFRSYSELHVESIWIWSDGLQWSLCPLCECSSGREKRDFSWVTEDMEQQTTWICLRKSVSCFRALIVPPDTLLSVILYFALVWRAWGGSYCFALCL